MICVGATDNRDALAGFSNHGDSTVDLVAPGVGVLSTVPNNSLLRGLHGHLADRITLGRRRAALVKSKNTRALPTRG